MEVVKSVLNNLVFEFFPYFSQKFCKLFNKSKNANNMKLNFAPENQRFFLQSFLQNLFFGVESPLHEFNILLMPKFYEFMNVMNFKILHPTVFGQF